MVRVLDRGSRGGADPPDCGVVAGGERVKLVVIESPFRGASEADRAVNVRYARAAMADCLNRGEAPLASHLLYPLVLCEDIPRERALGIAAGLAWARRAGLAVFYIDRGWSDGMKAAREFYEREGIAMEYRSIAGWPGGLG